MKLEKNIDENTLKNEVEEIKNLLETLTRKDLDNLSANVLWQERKPEVQK